MLKNVLIFFCLLSLCQASILFADATQDLKSLSIQYSPLLEGVLNTMMKLPEAKDLIEEAQKEGVVRILISTSNPVSQEFGACWDPDRRIIFVGDPGRQSRGRLIGSIIFELCNASVNSQIHYYDNLASRGQIDQENYVRGIEYLEYLNSKKASKIAEEGVRQGVFPATARLETYDSFDEHYYYQKISGHSDCIVQNFQSLVR